VLSHPSGLRGEPDLPDVPASGEPYRTDARGGIELFQTVYVKDISRVWSAW